MLLLLACVDDPTAFDEADLGVLLADPVEDLDQRARMSRPAPARLGMDGDELAAEALVEIDAVFDPGDEVGVVVSNNGIRYLAYLERDALETVTAERTRVRATPRGAARSGPFDDGESGAWIPAGRALQVDALGTPFSRVSAYTGYLRVDGYVPTGELDEVWTDSPPLDDAGEPDTWLVNDQSLHDGPGGEVFARTLDWGWTEEPTSWVPAVTLAVDRGWRRVRVDDGETVAIGWIEDQPTDRRGHRFRCGCCGWGDWSLDIEGDTTLPAGTVLHDGAGGPPVALALRERQVRASRDPLGGLDVALYTPWGEATLWVDDDAF
jgi:hypothetical protein